MTATVDKVEAGQAEEAKVKKAKAKREPLQELFKTAEEAMKAAADRVKGPRRAFKVELQGKTFNVVAHNEGRAGGVAFYALGGKCEEIGKVKRAAKPASLIDVLASVNVASMPEAEKAAVLAQLKALGLVK